MPRKQISSLMIILKVILISLNICAESQEIIVYSTSFDAFNARLPVTGQGSWVTNDTKTPGQPAGESDGLTRLQLPDNTTSLAAYIGGPYRGAYPPGKTNVMLWPEISGLGSTLKFEVQMLFQRSDQNGIYAENDTFAWTFLDIKNDPMLTIAFEPLNNDPDSRLLSVYNSENTKINLNQENTLTTQKLYDLEVLMVPKRDGLGVELNITGVNVAELTLPHCSTHNISAVTANWIMTDAKVHGNGIVTGFGSNYMAFDNYKLTSDYSDYITFESKKYSESEGLINVLAKICKPSEKEIIINYEVIDGTAKAGIDFELREAKPLTLKIPTGQISAAIEIPIIRDDIEEEDEYFTINFLSTSENTILTNDKIDVFIENSPNHQNPLEITKVIYLKELQEFKLTWSSNPGTTYLISTSDDLKTWTNDPTNLVTASGVETTFSLSSDKKKYGYFRVNIAE